MVISFSPHLRASTSLITAWGWLKLLNGFKSIMKGGVIHDGNYPVRQHHCQYYRWSRHCQHHPPVHHLQVYRRKEELYVVHSPYLSFSYGFLKHLSLIRCYPIISKRKEVNTIVILYYGYAIVETDSEYHLRSGGQLLAKAETIEELVALIESL